MGNNQTGHHRHEYDNGDVYEGEFLAGKRHGNGVYTSVNGSRYEGAWKDDQSERERQEAAAQTNLSTVHICVDLD